MAMFLAQAEPAPAPAPDPGTALPTSDDVPASSLGVAAGLSWRLARAGRDVPPALGAGLGLVAEHRLGHGPAGSAFALAIDFGYSRHAKAVTASEPSTTGQELPFEGTRAVSEFSFVALPTVARRWGKLRPWLGVGGGLAIGYLDTHEIALRPGDFTAARAVVRAAGGIDVSIRRDFSVGVRADHNHPLTTPTFTTASGVGLTPFGPSLRFALVAQSLF